MLRASTLFLVAVITASYAPAMCAQGFASAFPDLVERRIEIHAGKAKPGTIEIHTRARVLYFVLPSGRALRYPVGVGQLDKQWYGSTRIVSKRLSPPWTPPAVMRGERPPAVIPAGARNNPMGAAALVLADHELAIHGTNAPESIGEFASWGCIRMHNRHILDLYDRVEEGTPVLVMR